MFPVTHIYFHNLVFPGNISGTTGAIFPDLTLLTGLRWPETHRHSIEFYDSLTDDRKEKFLPFIRGFFSHAVDSEGLDYHGDEKYGDYEKGYSYLKSLPLIDDVIKACRVPEEIGHWKAHNIIEMGIESLIAAENPEIAGFIDEISEEKEEISEISEILSLRYPVSKEIFRTSILKYRDFIITSGDPLKLAESYGTVLDMRHGIKDSNPEEIAEVIERAKIIIKDEYMDFLLECAKKFRLKWPALMP